MFIFLIPCQLRCGHALSSHSIGCRSITQTHTHIYDILYQFIENNLRKRVRLLMKGNDGKFFDTKQAVKIK